MDRASLILRILYMNEEVKTPNIIKILILAAFVSMVLIIFLQQLKVPFMLEDLDYAKNLVTGEPLKSFDDISQSLGCIFFWKGGSLIAGFFLQLLLLSGGYVADFVNMLVMLLCSFLIFSPTKRSHQRMFFCVFSFLLLIALNVDWNNSYFRQFGAVNFFYPSVIMLALLNICAKIVDNNDDYKTLALDKLGLGDSDFENIYPYTDEIGKDSKGVRKGVSWQAAAGGFYYRSDLAKEYLGVEDPEAMQEKIGDWDKFVAAAKEISEKSSGKTALADTLGGMWQAYACGRTTPWVVDNKLQIDAFCEDFANTAKELWDCGGITKNSQWSDEWTAAGTNDSCMGYFVSTWGFGGFALTAAGGEGGATYGNWAVCEGPQPFFWGGTWIVVNPKTDNGEEARDFIISATSDEDQMSAYATSKPEYVNNSKVMDDLISSDTVFNKVITDNMGGQNFYAALAENAKTINFNGLITEYDAKVKADFIDAVKTEYLEGGASWEDTVEAFKDLVSEDITSLDWDE